MVAVSCRSVPLPDIPAAAPSDALVVMPSHSGVETSVPHPRGLPSNPYASFGRYTDYYNFNLSDRDLRDSLEDLLLVRFNSQTKWPPREYLPQEYDPENILELGKNPGIGIRGLHEAGIDGRGIGIALIDAPLHPEHQEYAGRLQIFERIGIDSSERPEMHGTAVASLVVGERVGTAPGADLYFIAARIMDFDANGDASFNFSYYARGIRRVLEINQSLSEDRKIRVISMQVGIHSDWGDIREISAAIEEARGKGIFVIYSNLEDTYGFGFHGLGRDPLADPEKVVSFEPAIVQIEDFEGAFNESTERLLVPMDSRTVADYTDSDGYIFDRRGGRSWAMPYLAGVYALALQIDPTMTGEHFWTLAMETGRTIEVETEEGVETLGPILDPVALIATIKGR